MSTSDLLLLLVSVGFIVLLPTQPFRGPNHGNASLGELLIREWATFSITAGIRVAAETLTF